MSPELIDVEVSQPHPIYSQQEVEDVRKTHVDETKTKRDRFAYICVKVLRTSYDVLSGWSFGKVTEEKALKRIMFLETVAGVPGFTAAMVRHLQSLRLMRSDYGWIHTLLEEAENEKMHLMTAMKIYEPGSLFRMAVVLTQGVAVNIFFLAYLVDPKFCHRWVGYLEEEAVHTYSSILKEIEDGNLSSWKVKPAPEVAKAYWKLGENASLKDVMLAIRADESHHRDVNHTFADLNPTDPNPFKPGE